MKSSGRNKRPTTTASLTNPFDSTSDRGIGVRHNDDEDDHDDERNAVAPSSSAASSLLEPNESLSSVGLNPNYHQPRTKAPYSPSRRTNNPFESPEEDDDNDDGEKDEQEEESGIRNNNNATTSVLLQEGNNGRIRRNLHPQQATSLAAVTTPLQQHQAPVAAAAEASWQYLGDLPYRRIPVYSNVAWHRPRMDSTSNHYYVDGLVCVPQSAVQQQQLLSTSQGGRLSKREIQQLVMSTTRTVLAGCPHGGPLAVVTVPNLTTTTRRSGPGASTHKATMGTSSSSAAAAASVGWYQVEIKIMTNSGTELSRIKFPPDELLFDDLPPPAASQHPSSLHDKNKKLNPQQHKLTPSAAQGGGVGRAAGAGAAAGAHRYTPADLVTMGFTSRTQLVVLLRDSTTLVYNIRGHLILPPFAILPSIAMMSSGSGSGSDSLLDATSPGDAPASGGGTSGPAVVVQQASIYDGGVAILCSNNVSAIAEILDDRDYGGGRGGGGEPPDRVQQAFVAAARGGGGVSGLAVQPNDAGASARRVVTSDYDPHYSVLITTLPTLAHARLHHCSYVTLCVLPGIRTESGHPDVLISTRDNSIVVANPFTLEITDVNCRTRLSSPIISMSVAPNGRFLAAFTESQALTVVSTNFETKVLDFDTSEGSSAPPAQLCWCGEDCVMLHWKNLGVLLIGPYGDWVRCAYNETSNQLFLVPDMDGCRVVTESAVELLQRVPPGTANLLRIGSIEPSAMLLDASDAFNHASSASSLSSVINATEDIAADDTFLPSLPLSCSNAEEAAAAIVKTGMLAEAIEACTEAASREFDIVMQKRLLRAASYGMHFNYKNAGDDKRLIMGGPVNNSARGGGPPGMTDDELDRDVTLLPSPTSIKFVQVARKLRVLNALRHPRVGFVLTSAQYDAITPAGVVARLVENFSRPALAVAIARYLRLPKSVQLYARAAQASALVVALSSTARSGKPMSDSEIAEAAIQVINDEGEGNIAISKAPRSSSSLTTSSVNHRGAYATVAMTANKVGRKGVANLLLMLETSVADKVPALISTGSYADAIAVATAARDSDFIFSTLMEYEKSCLSSTSDFSKAQATYISTVVSKFTPEAFHVLRRYLGTTPDVKSTTNLLVRAQRYTDAGMALAVRALGEHDVREKQGILAEASRVFALGKDTSLYKSCTDDYLELLKDQEIVRTKYGTNDVLPADLSVIGLLSSLLKYAAVNVREQHRLLSDADKIAKKFRVSERRLWHAKVRAFAESDQWSNLRILADSKKSPIGYKPFARSVIRGRQGTDEALRYIDRIAVPEERYDLFCEARLWKQALDEAYRMRDARRILSVKSLCNSPELQLQADQMMARLA